MGKYCVCILDDKLPAHHFQNEMDETKLLNENNIRFLLNDESKWEDTNLLELTKKIISENTYSVFGFKTPSFYLNYLAENIFTPDIIIFDWDVGTTDDDQENNLLEILQNTYCLVAVYTDNIKENIDTILKTKKFEDYYNSRLFSLVKSDNDSYELLQKEINDRLERNFSFKYCNELKQKTLDSLNNVLSNLGRLSFEQFISQFGEKVGNNKREISSLDLAEIISEKARSKLISIGFSDLPSVNWDDKIDNELLKKIWAFRLYHQPEDDIVRKGDIISFKGNGQLFLVISSDCHLNKFWQKNLGFLSVIPLYKSSDDKIINRLKNYTKSGTRNNFSISSIINPKQIENITFLPGLFQNNGEMEDYILSPKEVTSFEVKKPQKVDTKSPLKYSQLEQFDGVGRKRISEPFLTPLIQFSLKNITDLGVADFSPSLQRHLAGLIKGINNE